MTTQIHPHILTGLQETDPDIKAEIAESLWRSWQAGNHHCKEFKHSEPVDIPGRPSRPHLVPAHDIPRQSVHTPAGHAAMIHAITHIEFNAINLALDTAYRFPDLPEGFCGDWLKVAAEESRHFLLLRDHLRTMGFDYGDFPAHDGLWQMCRKTAHDPLVRIALVPRLLEARGLDANPAIVRKLAAIGDNRGIEILEVILRDEIGHVRIGNSWYELLCQQRGLDPIETFRRLIGEYDAPMPRPPLHTEARLAAGFSSTELQSLASSTVRRGTNPKLFS